MTIYKLKRVIWRIQEWQKEQRFTERELRRALMLECGTDRLTISSNKKNLMELGMIKRLHRSVYKVVTHSPA